MLKMIVQIYILVYTKSRIHVYASCIVMWFCEYTFSVLPSLFWPQWISCLFPVFLVFLVLLSYIAPVYRSVKKAVTTHYTCMCTYIYICSMCMYASACSTGSYIYWYIQIFISMQLCIMMCTLCIVMSRYFLQSTKLVWTPLDFGSSLPFSSVCYSHFEFVSFQNQL